MPKSERSVAVLPFKLSGNEVGDVVLAIGNPFGVGQTVTQGIISKSVSGSVPTIVASARRPSCNATTI
jgi:S1-C subfamily serine protease